jgi:4-carboxymuconolactone decarboxylase
MPMPNTEGERRFSELAPAAMGAEQKRAYDAIVGGPRGGARGPFNALLRSPELADRAQQLGAYVRFGSSLPRALNELAILVTARYWTAQFEWWAHARLAAEAGLNREIIASISRRERPGKMTSEEKAVYDFATELHEKKGVSDAVFEAVKALLGERGVLDLVGACGYYTLVSMVLNVERHPLPEGEELPLK